MFRQHEPPHLDREVTTSMDDWQAGYVFVELKRVHSTSEYNGCEERRRWLNGPEFRTGEPVPHFCGHSARGPH